MVRQRLVGIWFWFLGVKGKNYQKNQNRKNNLKTKKAGGKPKENQVNRLGKVKSLPRRVATGVANPTERTSAPSPMPPLPSRQSRHMPKWSSGRGGEGAGVCVIFW